MMQLFFNNLWSVISELAPWLLLGAAFAGILHVFLPSNFVFKHLGSSRFSSVLKAVGLGVPMPLCSCGVIPAAVGLKKDGASNGAAVGFLISTPQTGLDSIFVSASFLGLPFALFKVGSAFITGIIGGVLVNATEPNESTLTAKTPAAPAAAQGHKNRVKDFFSFIFEDLLYSIWKLLLLGIVLSALITTLVPENALAGSPYVSGLTGKLVVLVFSLTLYVCATSSVPIAASLVAAGMPAGSALVFLMAGPASNIATIGAVYKTFGKRVLTIYLLVISVGSILLGYLFDNSFSGLSGHIMHHEHGGSRIKMVFGIFFAVLLGYYAITDIRTRLKKMFSRSGPDLSQMLLKVEGMTCQVCAGKVSKAVSSLASVQDVSVDLEKKEVRVHGKDLDLSVLSRAIREKGYEVVGE